MTTTARDQIKGALRLIGALAEGETPSAETMNDSLTALNQMLDSWSIESLVIYSTQDQTFAWPSGQSTRTLGPSGNFVGSRPVDNVDWSSYYVDSSGLSQPLKFIDRHRYNDISFKSTITGDPEYIWVNPTMPNITMTVYRVPDENLTFHFISAVPLTQLTNLSDVLVFPPGYLRAFKFNLAVEISAEFGITPPEWVQRLAITSKNNIKRVNQSYQELSVPSNIPFGRGTYNIWTGDV